MIATSRRRAAHDAPDKWARVSFMADIMVDREATVGACTIEDLRARGLSRAEISAYHDPCLELISERPYLFGTAADGKVKGVALVFRAREIRRRIMATTWSAPQVAPSAWDYPQWGRPAVRELNALELRL